MQVQTKLKTLEILNFDNFFTIFEIILQKMNENIKQTENQIEYNTHILNENILSQFINELTILLSKMSSIKIQKTFKTIKSKIKYYSDLIKEIRKKDITQSLIELKDEIISLQDNCFKQLKDNREEIYKSILKMLKDLPKPDNIYKELDGYQYEGFPIIICGKLHHVTTHFKGQFGKTNLCQIVKYYVSDETIIHFVKGKEYAYVPIKYELNGETFYGHVSIHFEEDEKYGTDYKQNKIHCDNSNYYYLEYTYKSIILPDLFFQGKLGLSFDFDDTLHNTIIKGSITSDSLNDSEFVTKKNLTELGHVLHILLENDFDNILEDKIIINTSRKIINPDLIKKISEMFNISELNIKYQIKSQTGANRDEQLALDKYKRAYDFFGETHFIHFDDNQLITNTLIRQKNCWCCKCEIVTFPEIKMNLQPSEKKGKHIIEIIGPVGSGKSTLAKYIEKYYSETGATSISLSPDDGVPSLFSKKYNFPDILDYFCVIFDSTGSGQTPYPGSIRISLNSLNDSNFELNLLISLIGLSNRGLTHSGIMGCCLDQKDLDTLEKGDFIYNGELNNMNFVELLNTYPDSFVCCLMAANNYRMKRIKNIIILKYNDGQQKFATRWGVENGRGNVFMKNNGEWIIIKPNLDASVDNGLEKLYGHKNIQQQYTIFKSMFKSKYNFNIDERKKEYVLISKKDGLCFAVVRCNSKMLLDNYLSGYELEFYINSNREFILCTNGTINFNDEKKTVLEALASTYGENYMKIFTYSIRKFIKDKTIPFWSSIIFEFIPSTQRAELACQGESCISFLGVKYNNGNYKPSYIWDEPDSQIPFPIPFYWKGDISEIMIMFREFNSVVSLDLSLSEFLDKYKPSNTTINKPSINDGISFEGFVMLTKTNKLFKLKTELYYLIHKIFQCPDNLQDIIIKLISIFNKPNVTYFLEQFKNMIPIYELYIKNKNSFNFEGLQLLLENISILDILKMSLPNKKEKGISPISNIILEYVNLKNISENIKILARILEKHKFTKSPKYILDELSKVLKTTIQGINTIPYFNIEIKEFRKFLGKKINTSDLHKKEEEWKLIINTYFNENIIKWVIQYSIYDLNLTKTIQKYK